MFGTLMIYKDRLNEEEKAEYQAFYCGLCKKLREKFGLKSQLILTYDCTFLGMLLDSLYEEPIEEKFLFCAHKMARVRVTDCDELNYAADMNLLLAYQNYRDKTLDAKKGSMHRASAAAIRFLKKDYERIAGRYPRQAKTLETYMEKLLAYEKSPDPNPDYAANLTGEMLSEFFDEKQDEFSGYLRKTGYFLGKFIYLSDAYEDLEEDRKNGTYNPYAELQGTEGFDERIREHLESVMAECTKYFEMLPLFEHREILRNILYSGIWIPFAHARSKRAEQKGTPEKEQ